MTPQQAKTILQDLITRIDTQPSRSVAKPFLHLLQIKRRLFVPTCGGFGGWWLDLNDPESNAVQARSAELAASYLLEKCQTTIDPDFLQECDLIEWWETINAFLTKEGIKRHIALNEHNLDEYRDYQIHAFRNPELSEVLTALKILINEGSK